MLKRFKFKKKKNRRVEIFDREGNLIYFIVPT